MIPVRGLYSALALVLPWLLSFETVAAQTNKQIGQSSIRITSSATTGSTADAFLRVGLAHHHSYNFNDAINAFYSAQQALGRPFLLASVFTAISLERNDIPDFPRAQNLFDDVLRMRANGSATVLPFESDWIDAFTDFFARDTRRRAERETVKQQKLIALKAKYPNEWEITAYLIASYVAVAEPNERGFLDGQRGQAITLAKPLITELLKAVPTHVGGWHYYTHVHDDPVSAKDAAVVEAGENYVTAAPDVGHAHHMACHLYLRAGSWSDCIRLNTEAMDILAKDAGQPRSIAASHELEFQHTLFLQTGRWQEATAILKEIQAVASTSPSAQLRYQYVLARHVVETKQWSLALSDSGLSTLRQRILCDTCLDYANYDGMALWASEGYEQALLVLGMAAAELRNFSLAFDCAEALQVLATETSNPFVHRFLPMEMQMSRTMLLGLISWHQGDYLNAWRTFNSSQDVEDEIRPCGYGPWKPMKMTHELYGEMLLRAYTAYDQETAAAHFIAAFDDSPKKSQSVLGLARAYAATGDSESAATTYRQFLKAWSKADQDRPELAEATFFLKQYEAQNKKDDNHDHPGHFIVVAILVSLVIVLTIVIVWLCVRKGAIGMQGHNRYRPVGGALTLEYSGIQQPDGKGEDAHL